MKHNRVIVINGFPGSGKDTFVEFIQDHHPAEIFNIHSSDYIKKVAKEKFNWDGIKDEKGRKLLAELMNVSQEYNDGIFQQNKEEIKDLLVLHYAGFIHVREKEEIFKYVEEFETLTVLVERSSSEENVPDNNADKNVLDMEYDIYIYNDGTLLGLEELAKGFIKDYM